MGRASLPKEDPEIKDSVLGLQRSTSLIPKVTPPTEHSDVKSAPVPASLKTEPQLGADMSLAAGVTGASLLGRQQWTHLSRLQSPPTEDVTDSKDKLQQSNHKANLTGSS